jgi:hypothetical protein
MSINDLRMTGGRRVEACSQSAKPKRMVGSRAGGKANDSLRVENIRASPNAAGLIEHLWANVMGGSLVLAPLADRSEGWREAVVQERHGQIVTLRWWNEISSRAFTRRLKEIALLHPKLRL